MNQKPPRQPFSRLLGATRTWGVPLSLALVAVQVVCLVIDFVVYSGHPKFPFTPLVEELAPLLLYVPLRFVARDFRPGAEAEPYLRMLAGYFVLVLPVVLVGMTGFKVLDWAWRGEWSGGIYYLGSTLLAASWGIRHRADYLNSKSPS